jgi:broad specificity phosphatase PhoE
VECGSRESRQVLAADILSLSQRVAAAIDRVHRIGQEKTVYVTHFIVGILIVLLLPHILTIIRSDRQHDRGPNTSDTEKKDGHYQGGIPRQRL